MRIWKVSRSVCCFAALILAISSGCAPEAASEPTAQLTSGLLQVTGSYGQSVRGTVDGFPFLMLRGTHYERGKAHGALAASEVIGSVNAMATFINGSGVLTWDQAISGLAYFSFQSRFVTELTGMLDGIVEVLPSPSSRVLPALGRAITLNDLMVLQVGDQLELAQCSQFAAWGTMTANGGTIVGRNWDYPPLFSTSAATIIASDPAEAGLFSTIDSMWFGMLGNGISTIREDGLFLAANDASIDEPGVPFPSPNPSALRARELIETVPLATAPSSFAAGLANRVPLSLIFHVSMPEPNAQSLLPTVIEYDSRPTGGFGTKLRTATASLPNAIVLTNHYLQAGAPAPQNSIDRYNAIWNGLQGYKNAGTKLGFNEARTLLSSAVQSNTLYSVVAWPAERKLMVAVSPSPGVPAPSGVFKTVLWDEVFGAFPSSGPTITGQPANATVTVGQSATFSVTATGSALTYQWQKSGANIAGATLASYTTPATVLADSGATFRCVVTGSGGSVTSSSALLTVNASSVTITQQPITTTVTVGQQASFTVVASGSALTYQWQKNGANIAGATASTYTTPATIFDDNGAAFRCVVTGTGGSATSSAATLVVNSTATSPTGLRGQYYADTNFTSLYTTLTDPYINFTWGPEGDNFSIRWTGQVQAAFSEAYTLTTTSDGAVRVWLNNQLVVDNWTLHNSTVNQSSAPITLVAGRRYNLRVDYYDTVNTSVIQLKWQSASQAQQVIPTSRLFLP